MNPKPFHLSNDAASAFVRMIDREKAALASTIATTANREDLETAQFQAKNDLRAIENLQLAVGLPQRPLPATIVPPLGDGPPREFIVRVFGVAGLQFKVSAPEHQGAMALASAKAWPLFYEYFQRGDRGGEFAEEISHFLVDEVGDAEYVNSRFYEADGSLLNVEATVAHGASSDCEECGGLGWGLFLNEKYGWEVEYCGACGSFDRDDTLALFHVCRLAKAYIARRGTNTTTLDIPTVEQGPEWAKHDSQSQRLLGAVDDLLKIAESYIELVDNVVAGTARDRDWPEINDLRTFAQKTLENIRGGQACPPPAPPPV